MLRCLQQLPFQPSQFLLLDKANAQPAAHDTFPEQQEAERVALEN